MANENILISGQLLGLEQPLSSANGIFFLILQEDGDLVLYRKQTDGTQRPLWAIRPSDKSGFKCVMQDDGNFVLKTITDLPLWGTGTTGYPESQLVLLDDGNLIVRSKGGATVWSTKTTQLVSAKVVAFKDKGYAGSSGEVSAGGGLPWNDALSSLFVPIGLKVTLYKDSNFSGASMTLYEDTPWVGSSVNDQATSIRIEAGVRPTDRVTACYDTEFRGWNQELPIGRYDGSQLKVGVSSLRIPPGYKVTLYENSNFTGRSRICYGSVANLGSSVNHNVESLVVELGEAPGDRITIFTDRAFGGWAKELPIGRYSTSSLGISNDSLSSLQVPQGLRATLYEHADFGGRTAIYYSDTETVGSTVNDAISSVTVEAGEVPDDRITVFVDANFQGWCQEVPLGDTSSLSVGNDTISSVRVPPGLKAELYEHSNCTGRHVTCYGNTAHIGDSANDQITSIRVSKGQIPTDKVIIYSDGDFLGWEKIVDVGSYDTGVLGIGNDTLSSLRIPPGYRVTLFENAQFSGRSMVCYKDIRSVGDTVNDEVSSLRVEVGTPPTDLITAFIDKNHQGWNKEFGVGEYSATTLVSAISGAAALAVGTRDSGITSLRVPGGMQVDLYDNDGLSGKNISYVASTFNVASVNDITSSMRVTKFPPGPKPTPAEVNALIQQYGPRIYFHPDERYLPSTVEWFLERATLGCADGTLKTPPTPLPEGGGDDGAYWLQLPEAARGGNLNDAVVYVNVIHNDYIFDLQFWVFYPFNGYGSVMIRDVDTIGLDPMGIHTGDWEHFTLRFRAVDRKLLAIYLSQHDTGEWVSPDWLEQENGHSVVYASLRGHATFRKPGDNLMHTLRLKDPLFGYTLATIGLPNFCKRSSLWLDTSTRAVVFGSTAFDVPKPSWMNYKRRWGPHRDLDLRHFENLIILVICGAAIAALFTDDVDLRAIARKLIDLMPPEAKEQNGPTGPWVKRSWRGDDY